MNRWVRRLFAVAFSIAVALAIRHPGLAQSGPPTPAPDVVQIENKSDVAVWYRMELSKEPWPQQPVCLAPGQHYLSQPAIGPSPSGYRFSFALGQSTCASKAAHVFAVTRTYRLT